MKVDGRSYRTIWVKEGDRTKVSIIDQRKLPYRFEIIDLSTVTDCVRAIKEMYVRGAGLIGATAGYGMYLSAVEADDDRLDSALKSAANELMGARPTAKDLEWAVQRQLRSVKDETDPHVIRSRLFDTANEICEESVERGRRIGEHGVRIIEKISREKGGEPVQILTHCNAGWLGFVDHGSALAPVFLAHDRAVALHVWVDETRPRNQGARLTAWELNQYGVPHHLVVDNAGGHLMQHGMVDLVIVGADRVTVTGDVANKIGTYLKALAAWDNHVPFYVALPLSTFDWTLTDGVKQIAIEERDPDEIRYISGLAEDRLQSVLLCPPDTEARNFAFDVTPARLVTGLITERGICRADRESILNLFPEGRD